MKLNYEDTRTLRAIAALCICTATLLPNAGAAPLLQLAVDPATNDLNRSFDLPNGGTLRLEPGSVLHAWGTEVSTLEDLANAVLPNQSGQGGRFLTTNGNALGWGAAGNALTSNPLSQFASTTSGQLAGVVSNETGTGSLVFATSPSFISPSLGAATATSINGLVITSSTGSLTIGNGKTITIGNSLAFTGTDGSSVAFGSGGAVAYRNQGNLFTGNNQFEKFASFFGSGDIGAHIVNEGSRLDFFVENSAAVNENGGLGIGVDGLVLYSNADGEGSQLEITPSAVTFSGAPVALGATTATSLTLTDGLVVDSITLTGTLFEGTWNGNIIAPAYLGTGAAISNKFLRGDGTWQTIAAGGDALTSGSLAQFAPTTSAELADLLTDEALAGGSLIFAEGVSTGGNGGADDAKVAIFNEDGSLAVSVNLSIWPMFGESGSLSLFNNSGFGGALMADELTAPRTLQLPDASGTFLLADGDGSTLSGIPQLSANNTWAGPNTFQTHTSLFSAEGTSESALHVAEGGVFVWSSYIDEQGAGSFLKLTSDYLQIQVTEEFGEHTIFTALPDSISLDAPSVFLGRSDGTVSFSGTINSGTWEGSAIGVSKGGTGAIDAGSARSNLGLAIGTNVQAYDADLSSLAALSGTNHLYYRSAANTWSSVTIGSGLSFSGGTLSATAGGSGGSGDVIGPASAIDNTLVRYDGNTGKLIQASTVYLDDAGVLSAGTIDTNIVQNLSGSLSFSAWGTLYLTGDNENVSESISVGGNQIALSAPQLLLGESGTSFKALISNTATLDFPSIPAQSHQNLTITVSGATPGDAVALGVPNDSVNSGCLFFGWVSATNTVTIRCLNVSSGAQNPASGTFRATVTHY